jgi:hypothetical protein
VRPAAGAFTFAEVPRGRALSPQEIDAYARRLLAGMSLEEKVLQMSGDSWVWDLLTERSIGRGWKAGADRRLGLPPIVCTDGPRGVGMGSSTCFPTAMARAASWDRGLEARVADAAAREVRGHGANMWLAPCLNVRAIPAGAGPETSARTTWSGRWAPPSSPARSATTCTCAKPSPSTRSKRRGCRWTSARTSGPSGKCTCPSSSAWWTRASPP